MDNDEKMLGSEDNQPSDQPQKEPARTNDTVNQPPQYVPAPGQWPAQSAPPPQQAYAYGPPQLQQQTTSNVVLVNQQPAGYTYAAAPSRPDDYLGLSIFACLCCCWPIAIVALVHSCQVNDRYNAGDYAGAIDSSQKAKQWSRISIIVGSVISAIFGVIFVLYIILQVVVVAAAASTSP